MLEQMVAVVTLGSLIIYALLGGADFGGGVWDLLATGPRSARQRKLISNEIGPVWEANHVWLILVIVLLFTAFAPAFAAMMIALHIPMLMMLLGIVLRGSAFVFRKYEFTSPLMQARWTTVFGISSLLTPFFQGLIVGALVSGEIRVEEGIVTTGFFAGWLTPFAIACGVFTIMLFAYLAAVYLCVDAEGDRALQEDFRKRSLLSGVALVPIASLVFFTAREGAPVMFHSLTNWWAPFLLMGTSFAGVASLLLVGKRRFRMARMAAGGQVTLILVGWSISFYPYIIVPDLTVQNTAAPEITLRLVLIALALGAMLLIPSLSYLFYVFKQKGPR